MAEYLNLNERVKLALQLGESHFREFKSAIERIGGQEKAREATAICRDISETLVAFANADGGELIVGIEDDGSVSGVPHNEGALRVMMAAAHTHVHSETPLPDVRVNKLVLKADPTSTLPTRHLLYFAVPKSTKCVHLTADGRCLHRRDRENRPSPAERIQYERQEQRSLEYDREYVDGASTGDLDLELLAEISGRIMPGASVEKVLQYLGLAEYIPEGLRLRRAALLLFARDILRWHARSQVAGLACIWDCPGHGKGLQSQGGASTRQRSHTSEDSMGHPKALPSINQIWRRGLVSGNTSISGGRMFRGSGKRSSSPRLFY